MFCYVSSIADGAPSYGKLVRSAGNVRTWKTIDYAACEGTGSDGFVVETNSDQTGTVLTFRGSMNWWSLKA